MTHSLFTAPAGGSLQDKVNQALRFAQGAGGAGAAAPPEVEDVRALAGAAPDGVAPQAAAGVATEVASPVAAQSPDLAMAARAAAEQAIADPAFVAAAQQQVEVVVQPRLIVQGQSGPTIIPIDVPVPAAQANVTIAPATAVVVDPATGQAIASQVAEAAPAAPPAQAVHAVQAARTEAAAAPVRSFRSWGIEDLANLGRGGGAAESTIAADVAAATPAPVEATPSLLDRIRTKGPTIDDLAALGRRGGGAASVAGDAASTLVTAAADGRGASLLDQLRDAAQVAQRVNPKG